MQKTGGPSLSAPGTSFVHIASSISSATIYPHLYRRHRSRGEE